MESVLSQQMDDVIVGWKDNEPVMASQLTRKVFEMLEGAIEQGKVGVGDDHMIHSLDVKQEAQGH